MATKTAPTREELLPHLEHVVRTRTTAERCYEFLSEAHERLIAVEHLTSRGSGCFQLVKRADRGGWESRLTYGDSDPGTQELFAEVTEAGRCFAKRLGFLADTIVDVRYASRAALELTDALEDVEDLLRRGVKGDGDEEGDDAN